MSAPSSEPPIIILPPAPPQPARRSLLKRLSAVVAGSFLASPVQALFGRRLMAKGNPLAAAASPAGISSSSGGNPFVGEIIMAGFNFAPRGYVRCDGQLLSLSQNTALFSLLGTTYGGNGITNFALPNLNGRVVLGAGQLSGGSYYDLGRTGGAAEVGLLEAEMPAHTHTVALSYSQALGTTASPEAAYLASNGAGRPQYAATNTAYMATGATGSAQPHNNMQPYLTMAYYIAVQGVFPPRQ